MMCVGVTADHGAFTLKGQVAESSRGAGYEVINFGAHLLNPEDGYLDFIISLARAIAAGKIERGVWLRGSGVVTSFAANIVPGARAGFMHNVYSAHRTFEGNRPSNTIMLEGQSLAALGKLVAVYEHSVFTHGTIWQIDSFDQWGGELGEVLVQRIIPELETRAESQLKHDNSTNTLIRRYRKLRATSSQKRRSVP